MNIITKEIILKYGYSNTKDVLQKRLRRAEGQVRGIARMVEEDKYCLDILTQINAAQAALDKIAVELMRDHAKYCMTHTSDKKAQQEKAEELVAAISRMLSR
ncbi:MAG TPA: metal-sensitive transcriptional regulator [Candidatus Saccharimonadales bacterium]|nr:metal-sensitive transcriptional regulator [Candidatus Saccharimonadales bacterium]